MQLAPLTPNAMGSEAVNACHAVATVALLTASSKPISRVLNQARLVFPRWYAEMATSRATKPVTTKTLKLAMAATLVRSSQGGSARSVACVEPSSAVTVSKPAARNATTKTLKLAMVAAQPANLKTATSAQLRAPPACPRCAATARRKAKSPATTAITWSAMVAIRSVNWSRPVRVLEAPASRAAAMASSYPTTTNSATMATT